MIENNTYNETPSLEVLAPVGATDMVSAAIFCGANAIYLGFSELNARAKSQDFSEEELEKIIIFAHQRGVRVYLTLNTLVFTKEIPRVKFIIQMAANLGVDAIIVQDLGVFRLVKNLCPKMPIHGSTQMSVGSVLGAKKLEEMGFTRVVLGRELSKAEIEDIIKNTSLQVEVFVQGAHCVSVSGQCYLSSFVGGRSGNRGLCAQPCRLPFSSKKGEKDYNLSLKDLSLIENIGELIEIGVHSIKIEGRMKRPEYVAAAVTACVAAKNKEDLSQPLENLRQVFSRSGFTDGFYKDEITKDMFGTRIKQDVSNTSKVLKTLGNLYHKERPLIPVNFSYTQIENQPIKLSLSDEGDLLGRVNTATASGEIPINAISNPTDENKAYESIEKLGSTPFYTQFDRGTFKVEPTLMVRMSEINKLRREAVDELLEKRSSGFEKDIIEYEPTAITNFDRYRKPKIRGRFQKISQIPEDIINGDLDILEYFSLPAKEMVDNLDYILDNFSGFKDKIIIEPPRISFSHEQRLLDRITILKEYGFMNMEVSSLSHIKMAIDLGMKMFGGFSLNIFNTEALKEYKDLGMTDSTLSLELDLKNIRTLDHSIMKLGSVVHGFLPMMSTKSCPGKNIDVCSDCKKSLTMFDRIGNKYHISCENYEDKAFSEIYNPFILYMGNKLRDINCLDFITLYFTNEDKKETLRVIKNYYENSGSLMYKELTRGLFYKEIQ